MTAEQETYLKTKEEEYMAIHNGNKNYRDFWGVVQQQWFSTFPEAKVLFPEKDVAKLTDEESRLVTDAMNETLLKIKRWFRWRAKGKRTIGPGHGGDASRSCSIQPATKRRLPKAEEIYSKLYYETRIQQHANDEIARLGVDKTKAVSVRARMARDLFMQETEEIKQEVLDKLEEEKTRLQEEEDSEESAGPRKPSEYQRAIDDTPAYLRSIFRNLAERTGWSFSVVMGGPLPQNGGQIVTASFHEGLTPLAFNFGQSYAHYNSHVVEPFTRFLDELFSHCVREKRSLYKTDDSLEGSSTTTVTVSSEAAVHSPDIPDLSDSQGTRATQMPLESSNILRPSSTTSPDALTTSSNSSGTTVYPQNLLSTSSIAVDGSAPFPQPSNPPPPAVISGGTIESSAPLSNPSNPPFGADTTSQVVLSPAMVTAASGGGTIGSGAPLFNPSNTPFPLDTTSHAVLSPGSTAVINGGMIDRSAPLSNPSNPSFAANTTPTMVPTSASGTATSRGTIGSSAPLLNSSVPSMTADVIHGGLGSSAPFFSGPSNAHSAASSAHLGTSNPPFVFGGNSTSQSLDFLTPTSTSNSNVDFSNNRNILESSAQLPVDSLAPNSPDGCSGTTTSFGGDFSAQSHLPFGSFRLSDVDFSSHSHSTQHDFLMADNWMDTITREDILNNHDLMAGPTPSTQGDLLSTSGNDPNNVSTLSLCSRPSSNYQYPLYPDPTRNLFFPSPPNVCDTTACDPNSLSEVTTTKIALSTFFSQTNTASLSSPPATVNNTDPTAVSQPEEGSDAPRKTPDAMSALPPPTIPTAESNTRSSRKPVPSKRHEEMNKIGTNEPAPTFSADEKENVAPDYPAPWAVAAKDFLLALDLGSEWRNCVLAWVEVEHILGYGFVSGTKAGLPANGRPDEWTKWAGKTKNGERPYKNPPIIHDSAEFGHTLVRWWNNIQPSFRQNDAGLPKAIYSSPQMQDPWNQLRRAGHNGLVSVLIMLAWWGSGLKARSQWQQDSSATWKDMVLDVAKVFGMVKSVSAGVRKRVAGTNGDAPVAKRTRRGL